MRHVFLAMAAATLLPACKSTETRGNPGAMPVPKMLDAPRWVTQNGNDPRYPRERYLVGYGIADDKSADGLEQARVAAQTDIASQIEVQIKSQIEVITKQLRHNEDIDLKEDFSQISQSETAELFRGSTLVDSYQDPQAGRWYALAVLQREQLASALLSEAESLLVQSKTQQGESIAAKRSHSPTVAMKAALAAYAQVLRIEKNSARALAVQPYDQSVQQRVQALAVPDFKSAVVSQLNDLAARIQLEVVSGNQQQGLPGTSLAQPLVFRALYHEDDRAIPVSYFPVTVNLDAKAGRVVWLRDTTDGDGQAAFRLQEIKLTGRNANPVVALLNYVPFAGSVSGDFARQVTFTYFLPTIDSTRVLVAIDERIDGRQNADSMFAGRLSESLSKLGVAVIKGDSALNGQSIVGMTLQELRSTVGGRADYVIGGAVECSVSEEAALGSKIVTFKTRASINVHELATGRVFHVEQAADKDTLGKQLKEKRAQAAAQSIENACKIVSVKLNNALKERLVEGKDLSEGERR